MELSRKIGDVAKELNVSAHTLRYYEKIKLLPVISKNQRGQRVYSDSNIQRIQFIKRAQRMQFSLDEIKQLITLDQETTMPKSEAQTLVKAKLVDINDSLRDLLLLKENLSQLLSSCEESDTHEKCPILEGFKK
jgi:MerR family copper efflux transcriptional regulator